MKRSTTILLLGLAFFLPTEGSGQTVANAELYRDLSDPGFLPEDISYAPGYKDFLIFFWQRGNAN